MSAHYVKGCAVFLAMMGIFCGATGVSAQAKPEKGVLMPDLISLAPYDLRLVTESGNTRLRFTATFWNGGRGAMELNTKQEANSGDGSFDASQRLFRADGSFLDTQVGKLFWHNVHGHYHYSEFGKYLLEMVRPASGSVVVPPVVIQKTTFCLRDDLSISASGEAAKQGKKYGGCRGYKQGVSVGWADKYPSTLPDQYVDVQALPAGIYKLSFWVDPNATFSESRRDNNIGTTFFELDPAKRVLKILATASPYHGADNQFADGLLVRGEGEEQVYEMFRNKKRRIPNAELLKSAAYANALTLVLPPGVISTIPTQQFVRAVNGREIYLLNADGFKRRLLNPSVLTSYGWRTADISVISEAELQAYPTTDLIMRLGDRQVFSTITRAPVELFHELERLGRDPRSVQMVNAMDFASYAAAEVVARDLFVPWSIAFLPDGDKLVTERDGNIRRLGAHPATLKVPSVLQGGEGGLMGMVLDPNFKANQFLYLYFTANDHKNRVVRYTLRNDQLIEEKILVKDIPSSMYHDGGQLQFGPDGFLYVTTGDAQKPPLAQDKSSLAGKILRVTSEGRIPEGNPFGNLIWSYGHRNPQGLAWDTSGRLYATEHGPTGDLGQCCRDELNRIERGGNYGWPTITGDQKKKGMSSPLRQSGAKDTWAPSGMAFADGHLFFTGLRGATIFDAALQSDGSLKSFSRHLTNQYGRLRAIVLGPDGYLYITTSNRDGRGAVRAGDDKILRIHPAFLIASPK